MSIDKETSKRNKKGKGLNKAIKKGVIVVTALGLLTIGTASYAYKYVPNTSEKLSSKVVSVDNDTFNSIISNRNDIELVYNLEENMSLDDTLSNLKLDAYKEGLNTIDSSNYSETDITELITEYDSLLSVDKNTPSKDSIRFFELVAILSDYNNKFSSAIDINTLSVINYYADTIIKVSIIDALKLDANCINNLSTNLTDLDERFICIYTDPVSGKDFELKIGNFNNLNSLVKEVRTLNKKFAGEIDKKGNFIPTEEPELIKQQEKVLNALKMSLDIKCRVSNGIVKEENNVVECIQQKIKCK